MSTMGQGGSLSLQFFIKCACRSCIVNITFTLRVRYVRASNGSFFSSPGREVSEMDLLRSS